MPENLNNSSLACGFCDLEIVDSESDSIQCDVCDRWFHAEKQCSSLKKTIFKLMREPDTWVCPACLTWSKSLYRQDPVSQLNKELAEVRDLNHILFNENKKLSNKISMLEKQLSDLKLNRPSLQDDRVPRPVDQQTQTSQVVKINCDGEPKAKSIIEPCQDLLLDYTHVHLLADSHGRDVRFRLEDRLRQNGTTVSSAIYPGAPMHHYVNKIVVNQDQNQNRSTRRRKRTLNVIMGGVNDTSEESVNKVIQDINSQFSNDEHRPSVVVIETPYRYDDVSLNESIKKQNKRLKEICNSLGCPFISINFSLFRYHYNKKGLHLNDKGKDMLCAIIADSLKRLKSNFLV
jgi:hypothetical protein